MNSTRYLAYQPALDGIRAIAVLSVFAYHLDYGWAGGGFLGVDMFFVLSGFLITTLLLRENRVDGRIGLGAFWIRRARRLLPALLLLLLVTAIAAATFIAPTELDRLRGDALASLFYVANWRFIFSGQSYFDLFAAPSPLRHLWSLAIEEQFYLVWPLIVAATLAVRRRGTVLLATLCAMGIVVSMLRMAALFDVRDPSRAYFATDARAHSLLVGCVFAIALEAWRPAERIARYIAMALPLIAIAIVVALVSVDANGSLLFHGGSFVFAVLTGLLIVGATSSRGGVVAAGLSVAPLRWIGRVSYGLYLWHWPLIVWLTPARVGFGGWPLDALIVGATFAAASLSYYLVERPIRNVSITTGWRVVAAPAAIALSAALIVGGTAAAEPQPSYLGSGGSGPQQCQARPGEVAAASKFLSRSPALRLDHLRNKRVLLVGDSTACSLAVGLEALARAKGFEFTNASVSGCGVVSDVIKPPPGVFANTTVFNTCPEVVRAVHGDAFNRARPDVVLWASGWERHSLVTPQGVLASGSPQWRDELNRRMTAALDRFGAGGARLVMVTEPPRAPGIDFSGNPTGVIPADDVRMQALNAVNTRFAHDHDAEVSLIDLRRLVCPDGPPCPKTVGALTPRPDGVHYGLPGSVWASEWILRQVNELER